MSDDLEDDEDDPIPPEWGELNPDDVSRIVGDVLNGILPARSRVRYGPAELSFRASVEKDIAEDLAANPGTIIDIPADIGPMDMPEEPPKR